jgi:hypothetical protein
MQTGLIVKESLRRPTRYFPKRSRNRFGFPVILSLIWLLAACAPAESLAPEEEIRSDGPAAGQPLATPTQTAVARPLIVLPISVYIVDGEDERFASTRDEANIIAIYERVNEIWSQAGIVIELQRIQRLTLSDEVVLAIRDGDFHPFLAGIDTEFSIPAPSLLNGFYASRIGGPNGIAPAGARLFFVTDSPSVHDERVTSHEIGHILGLHHVLDDPGRLMFSGTNGTALSEQEIDVARYVAQGMLDRLR